MFYLEVGLGFELIEAETVAWSSEKAVLKMGLTTNDKYYGTDWLKGSFKQ